MLKAEARKLMPKCQTAVPVWIMPLSRVVDNFDPGKNRFDVIIIDEASQLDLMAHIALYMGDQIIIVGDDEQVSPVGVGQRQDEIQGLIATLLQDIPNRHLYDTTFSIYDLAMTVVQPICLREHFRCATEIINFSNKLSYDWKIRPLRDTSAVTTKPHTVYYRVDEAVSEGKVNKQEALVITALIAACIQQPEYKDATFGVISLVGEEQALYIDTLLRKYLGPVECERRNIQCGNSAHFQGDERDIIFLSMVDTCNQDPPLPLRMEGAFNMYKKRYNVATSRARDQMWVVSSLNSIPGTDLKEGDYRLRLIQHAIDPNAFEREIEKVAMQTESDFEKQVAQRLIQAGYKVVPQWKVGSYRIDLVVEGSGKRLAVECDGDRYHTIDNLQEDMNRQAILERLGWQFVRIRGTQFYRNPDKTMTSVFDRLKSMGIPPTLSSENEVSVNQDNDLLERIKRNAAEIRDSWDNGKGDIVSFETKAINRANKKDISQTTLIHKQVAQSQSETSNLESDPGIATIPLKTQSIAINKSVNTKNHTPQPMDTKTNTNISVSVIQLLENKELPFIDKRDKDGALWVFGGDELKPIMDELEQKGYKFIPAPNGGKATKKQAAWWYK
jgi:very-short-patch-repair endonuclease